MNTGKIPEAIEEARKALEARPRADHLHRLMANLLVETGDFEGAPTEARRAVALREWHQNHYTLGYVLYRAGRFEECAAAFRRATELQPDNAWAFQALGAALHEAGHATEAEAAYKKAIAVDPGAASMAWASLGTLHYESDRAPEAVEAFRKALELEPASGVMHRNLGDALARQSRAEEARAEWREGVARSASALRVNSRQVTDLVNAAICRAKLGESAAALEAVATALEVAPRDREALSGAAAVHALVGDPRRASSTWSRPSRPARAPRARPATTTSRSSAPCPVTPRSWLATALEKEAEHAPDPRRSPRRSPRHDGPRQLRRAEGRGPEDRRLPCHG
jgi:tetratricopeptide (TPR) repeat protein